MHILIVDDEPGILNFLRRLLQKKRYFVDTVRFAETALKKIYLNPYALIILAISPSNKEKTMGFCEKLRKEGIDTPILILSYLDATTDKIEALNKGADEYLPKPFHPEEFFARVNSLLRRQSAFTDTILRTGDLSLNTKTYEVKRGGKIIYLSGKQFALLRYLLTKKGKIVPKAELVAHLWGNRPIKSNALEVLIRRLRRSIDQNYKKKLITMIYGAGYKIRSM